MTWLAGAIAASVGARSAATTTERALFGSLLVDWPVLDTPTRGHQRGRHVDTAQSYPDNRPDDNGNGSPDYPDEVGVKHRLDKRQLPDEPHSLSLWDILRTYRANPAKGYDIDLNVDDESHSVLAFIDRAVDIHEIDDKTRQVLRQCLDPLGTSEPYESLPKL